MTESVTPMPKEAIHAALKQAFDALAAMHGRVDLIECDTAFAVGEALGTIGKAKALVWRDINDESRRSKETP